MAEELNQTQIQEHAEENSQEKEFKKTDAQLAVKEKCEKLFELLSKEKLSEEDSLKVRDMVEKAPSLLIQKEFVAHFDLPHFASAYKKGDDIMPLLEQNSTAILQTRRVLDNLKGITVKPGDSNKTAAAYFLDEGRLLNGELVGTQAIKNMHFLHTAISDKTLDFSPEQREGVASALREDGAFLKSIYDKDSEHGYGANRNRRNASGQKADDLMEHCLMVSEMQDQTVEDVQKRSFMREPKSEEVDAQRANLTMDQIKTKVYQGKSLTVEEKELLKKAEDDTKEASMGSESGDRKRPAKEHQKGEPFKEGDVIKYMYEEWFLAGLSWLFDQADKGLEILLDKLIDSAREAALRNEEAARNAKDKAQKELFAKVASFSKGVGERQKKLLENVSAQKNKYAAVFKKLNVDYNNLKPDEERKLKNEFGSEFIDKLKADYKKDPAKVQKFLNSAPAFTNQCINMHEKTAMLAMEQVRIEMMDEVMKSTGAWRNKGTKVLKTDEELLGYFSTRATARQAELMKAVSVISEDERLRAEAEYSSLKSEEQSAFVQKNVFDVYDQRIESETDPKIKDSLTAKKRRFEEQYNKNLSEGRSSEAKEMLFGTIASIKVEEFLNEQTKLTKEAQDVQEKDDKAKKYDVMGHFPSKTTSRKMSEAENRRKSVINNGLGDQKLFEPEGLGERIETKKTLYEEAISDNKTAFLGSMRTYSDREQAAVNERRKNNEGRRTRFLEYKQKITANNVLKARTAPMRYGGRS